MSDEAAFSVTKEFHTIRGTDFAEFRSNVETLLGDGSFDRVATSFQDAFGVGASAAIAVATASFPAAAPVLTVAGSATGATSTVGGVAAPVPQPTGTPGAPAQPAAPPAALPGAAYPGDCAHGPRVYKTIARGGPWRRWDCAIPYSAEAQKAGTRCKAVNV